MGMFDTVLFDPPIPCPQCGADIRSDQTKAFDCTLDTYRVGDCIAHAEEIRIVGDELHCDQCRSMTGKRYYLAVYRGILVGIEEERAAAEALLRSFSFEKLLLWYHDLHHQRAEHFMRNVCEWFEGGYDKMTPEDRAKRMLLFIWDRDVLEQSDSPLAALRRFLAQRKDQEQPGDDAGQLSSW